MDQNYIAWVSQGEIVLALLVMIVVLRWRKRKDAAVRYAIVRQREGRSDQEALCKTLETAAPVAETKLAQLFVGGVYFVVGILVLIAVILRWWFPNPDWYLWSGGLAMLYAAIALVPNLHQALFSLLFGLIYEDPAGGVADRYVKGLKTAQTMQHKLLEQNIREQLETMNAPDN